MIELKVAEIRVAGTETPPVVVLAEVDGEERLLPIWMTHGGAAAILGATEEPDVRRPSIHDLAGLILSELGASELSAVHIVGCEEGQFFAELVFADRRLPARPSDAIALALRVSCPIRCTKAVMEAHSVAAEAVVGTKTVQAEAEVERFLEFLDTVTPDDFTGEEKP
ncbi:bifunctional nuclease family protein [Propionicimonas sp.]|uniref:bifunctional nuclease family protein n=1 Tax=Propionicimonas sp. TaxID=1955623 RepID=UPI0017C18448|nr:bifunctional nuclease family protein [Propionicimonas sp.]MBU3977297.1 bifunctional nuclease family protein [Actinomycetota bacterium]MBA3021222.1 bifunctional nuclease family protein [Propionicimonas sp.]MBU3985807.1 bifunctional nuclease family protein [Actinomycetota bacterium]MBU4008592.1 bifunctional nuclease family protein [Actinomycetota bacterium]MBU4066258.1 bifunctional nuclease family protein [Actinomycetota bacterium]